jgi:hypothetical protein
VKGSPFTVHRSQFSSLRFLLSARDFVIVLVVVLVLEKAGLVT